MEDKSSGDYKTILISPEKTPYAFTIIVRESKKSKQCTFEVTGNDPVTGIKKTCIYQIQNREHNSYLDLFENLSKDFGLRLPQNRKSKIEYDFTKSYNELLTKNLVPEMLYGYGDPAVLRVEQEKQIWYYLISTSNDAPDSFPICRSKNLEDWEFVGFVFPKGKKPEWAAEGEYISDYWAPEMHRVKNEYRVYFVARDKNTLELCIGVARSLMPEGPFIADKEPILKGDKIDPHVFVEDDDNTFLYWKEDNNGVWPNLLTDLLYKHPGYISKLFIEKEDQITASFIVTLWPWIQRLKTMEAFLAKQIFIEAVINSFSNFKKRLLELAEDQPSDIKKNIQAIIYVMRTPFYAQKLSANGSSLIGEKKLIMENDQEWEAHLIEGMWITKYDDKFYLFYSGNDFSTSQYGIGVAIADDPLGPFKKLSDPILRSTEQWWAPGHPSVAAAPDGKPYLFFHGFFPNQAGYKEFRVLLSVPITFEKEHVVIG